jgi:hypothetical protein
LAKRAIKPDLFNNYVLKKLLDLATDKIPNIRLCVARCLSKSIMENRKFFNKNYWKFKIINSFFYLIPAYYNSELRDSKKLIQQHIKCLEDDLDQDVRESVFNPNKIPVRLPTPPPENDEEEDEKDDSGAPLEASDSYSA